MLSAVCDLVVRRAPVVVELVSCVLRPGAAEAVVRIGNVSGSRETIVRDVSAVLRSVSSVVRSAPVAVCGRTGWRAVAVPTGGSVDVPLVVSLPDGFVAGAVTITVDTYSFAGVVPVVFRWFVSVPDEPAVSLAWRAVAGWELAPVGTHMWTPSDRLVDVVGRYVAPHRRDGDVLVVAESPLSVLQGRLRHPDDVRVRPGTRVFARCFSGVGSLGSAHGLQCLIDEVGYRRFVDAFAVGAASKLVGRSGGFYRRLGRQAALVDDVSGTTAPYDQFVVLGPRDADAEAAAVFATFGLGCVVVDANDLGCVDVVGAAGVPASVADRLVLALAGNPAGNGDERTPLVLARPM